jgi:hypothetical protein
VQEKLERIWISPQASDEPPAPELEVEVELEVVVELGPCCPELVCPDPLPLEPESSPPAPVLEVLGGLEPQCSANRARRARGKDRART